MNAAAGLTPEKNVWLISAAKAPTSKKSYHSNTVPREDANTSELVAPSSWRLSTTAWVPSRAGASSIMSSPRRAWYLPTEFYVYLARACQTWPIAIGREGPPSTLSARYVLEKQAFVGARFATARTPEVGV